MVDLKLFYFKLLLDILKVDNKLLRILSCIST